MHSASRKRAADANLRVISQSLQFSGPFLDIVVFAMQCPSILTQGPKQAGKMSARELILILIPP